MWTHPNYWIVNDKFLHVNFLGLRLESFIGSHLWSVHTPFGQTTCVKTVIFPGRLSVLSFLSYESSERLASGWLHSDQPTHPWLVGENNDHNFPMASRPGVLIVSVEKFVDHHIQHMGFVSQCYRRFDSKTAKAWINRIVSMTSKDSFIPIIRSCTACNLSPLLQARLSRETPCQSRLLVRRYCDKRNLRYQWHPDPSP